MTAEESLSYTAWLGRDVYDRNSVKIGRLDAIYYDEVTGQPEWLTVTTGFFGTRSSFVPIAGSTTAEAGLAVPYDKDFVKGAPNVESDGFLEPEDTRALFEYYDLDWSGTSRLSIYGDRDRADTDYPYTELPPPTLEADTTAVRAADQSAEVTRSEEQLVVGSERVETGRARLRKYVVTETQTVQVPITREEVRVEREPIEGTAVPGEISGFGEEAELEVVLHEERPVVSKETVPKERVRLVKDVETDTETVTEDLRKEQIEVEGDRNA